MKKTDGSKNGSKFEDKVRCHWCGEIRGLEDMKHHDDLHVKMKELEDKTQALLQELNSDTQYKNFKNVVRRRVHSAHELHIEEVIDESTDSITNVAFSSDTEKKEQLLRNTRHATIISFVDFLEIISECWKISTNQAFSKTSAIKDRNSIYLLLSSFFPLTPLSILRLHTNSVGLYSICPLSSGKIATAGQDHVIKIWNPFPNKGLSPNIQILSGGSGHQYSHSIFCLETLPGNLLVSGGSHYLRIWDLNTLTCIKTIRTPISTWCMTSIFYKEKDESDMDMVSLIVSGHGDNNIRVWDTKSSKLLSNLIGHTNKVTSIAKLPSLYDSDKSVSIISSSYDKSLKIWTINDIKNIEKENTYKPTNTLRGHTAAVQCLAVIPIHCNCTFCSNSINNTYNRISNTRRVVSGSLDHTLKVWNIDNQECINTMTGHSGKVFCVAVLPLVICSKNSCNDNISFNIVSGSSDMSLKLWDLNSGIVLQTLSGHSYSVCAINVLSNGLIASGKWDNSIIIWAPTSQISTGVKHPLKY